MVDRVWEALAPAGFLYDRSSNPHSVCRQGIGSSCGRHANRKGATIMANQTNQAKSADYIQQLIDELGPRTTQRVLEILNDDSHYAYVAIPPVRMVNGMLYRRARNSEGGMPC